MNVKIRKAPATYNKLATVFGQRYRLGKEFLGNYIYTIMYMYNCIGSLDEVS